MVILNITILLYGFVALPIDHLRTDPETMTVKSMPFFDALLYLPGFSPTSAFVTILAQFLIL